MNERGRPRRVTCRICDRHVSECGPLSARGKCEDCGIGRTWQNAVELHEMRGESLARWRRGVARSVGAILPEDLPVDD